MTREMWLPYEEEPFVDFDSSDEDIEAYVEYRRAEYKRAWHSYDSLYQGHEPLSDEVLQMFE